MSQIVQSPDRFPHKCMVCLCGPEAGRDFWIDLGETDNPPGEDGPALITQYFCNLCLAALAVELDFATPTQKSELEARVVSLEGDLFDARVKADGLEQALDGLLRARFVDDPTAAVLVSHVESDGPLDAGSTAEGRRVDAGEGTPAEPHEFGGLADLRPAPEQPTSGWPDLQP